MIAWDHQKWNFPGCKMGKDGIERFNGKVTASMPKIAEKENGGIPL